MQRQRPANQLLPEPPSGNGFITTDVLKEILAELDPRLTPADLENIIEEVDEDGSGTLDFDGEDA